MTISRSVRVRFFGAFRKYFEQKAELEIAIGAGMTAGALRERLDGLLKSAHSGFPFEGDQSLLSQSALADERRVLQDSEAIDHATEISVLPPVCGG